MTPLMVEASIAGVDITKSPARRIMAVHGKIGFRVRTDVPRADAELVAQLRTHATSNLADAMGRFHFMDFGIRPRSGLSLCGVAVTVDARPADNLMVHKALEVAEPGDIIVVNTNGNTTSAVFGELMCRTAVGARLGGIVVDGAIRDVDGITALEFPAYSRALCAGGCDKDGPGEVNSPIACGNTVVMPGDIIVGDEDGVVVIPREEAADVLQLVAALVERERARIAEINSGVLFKDEINETLRKKGVLTR
jgi:regulator of RNase E activity RraA